MTMGTEVVLHTPQWHGNTITVNGMRTGVVDRLPANKVVADMVSDNLGNWLCHCDIRHITEGMSTRYQVVD